MTDPNQHQTPPAWYPDPDPNNPGGQRWWDGARWTEHSRPAVPAPQPLYDAGQDARPPAAQHPTSTQPGYARPSQPAYPPSATQPTYAPTPAPAYASGGYAGATPDAAAFPPVKPGTSGHTWAIWLVVGLPLLIAIAYMFVDFTAYFRAIISLSASGSNPGSGDVSRFSSALSGFVIEVLLIDVLGLVIYGLSVMVAYFDWRELQRRGFVRPFHWAWTFLSQPVYVIGRTVVARRRGGTDTMWPIWGMIAVFVIIIVLVVIKVVMVFNVIYSTVGTYGPGVS